MDRVKIYHLPENFKADQRGWVMFPFQAKLDGRPTIDLFTYHLARSEPGAVRGNHYHPNVGEWLHVFGGECTLYYEEDGGVKSAVIDREDTLVYIPAGNSHAAVNTSDGPVYLWAFRKNPISRMKAFPGPWFD